jgi:preprotein translocase subunit YajC
MHKIIEFWEIPFFAQQAPTEGPGFGSFLPLIFIFLAMWFLLIAPQRKKQKLHQKMVSALATGDEVITTGGIYGVVTNVKPDRFVLRIGDGTKIEVNRAFIHTVEKKGEATHA